MNKRILIISNDMPLALGLYSGLCQEGAAEIQIDYEPNGTLAYSSIKDTEPDLLVVDIETPGLSASWVSLQLEGTTIKDEIPTVGISRLLNNEEREILTDLTGVQIHPGNVSLTDLKKNIMATLVQ